MARDNSLIWIVLIVAAAAASRYFTGEMKEAEFRARLAATLHKTDTVRTIDYFPQPRRDSVITAQSTVMTHSDSARIDSAFNVAWIEGEDSTRTFIQRISAKARTSVAFDSVGKVDVEFNPLDRMFTIGLEPAPVRQINTRVTDSILVSVPVSDSFLTRATYITIGVALGVLIRTISR